MSAAKPDTAKTSSPHGRVTFLDGRGDLPMIEITTPKSTAEVYFHGAHVTHFQKQGEPPLLFLSQCSNFADGHPIRGGIPIIFPWFGKPADKPGQHGLARIKDWELREFTSPADGSVTVRFRLPDCGDAPGCVPCAVEYVVTVSDTLSAELIVTNKSTKDFEFENCLHTYFTVGEIKAVSVVGLKGVDYLDQPSGFTRRTENEEAIRIASEVDRIYLDTPLTVEIRDEALRRVIRVEKQGSAATVVWNPWIAKSKAMQDFGDEEYTGMICVESGNVALNKIKLPPGRSARLKVKLSSAAMT
jgi:D-hexose-6-phosphate mutarotase